MVGGGIAPCAQLHDDYSTMMRHSASAAQDQGSAALAVCEAAALATRTRTLLAELSAQLDAFANDTSPTRRLDAPELEQLTALGDETAEVAAQVALILDSLPHEPLVAGEQEITDAARAALADGIVDHRRALWTASLLPADVGFAALAQALVDSDAHVYWTARVVDVLAAFRDVDEQRARQVAALAGVPPTARFSELRPERVLELAQVARQLGAR